VNTAVETAEIEHATIRVFVVDDHPVVREGLRAMLNGDPRIEVVGEAGSGEEAIQKMDQLEPDVALVDIRMPGMGGIELTQRIKAEWPNTATILLTMYDNEMYVVEALRAGAAGYLVKDSTREFLCHAIDVAVRGGTIVRSGLLHQAIHGLLRTSSLPEDGHSEFAVNERFTPREFDVLRLMAQGHPNRQIAADLNLAEVTVKKHVQSIIAKLGASDRTQAALVAVRLGLVQ